MVLAPQPALYMPHGGSPCCFMDDPLKTWIRMAKDSGHPREEHLLPAMVVAGSSQAAGRRAHSDTVLDTGISGLAFP